MLFRSLTQPTPLSGSSLVQLVRVCHCLVQLEVSDRLVQGRMVLLGLVLVLLAGVSGNDLNRQSIIFNENTPDVFYCPQEKPISIDRMLVKSKPMKKLCEHDGRPLPPDAKSDCWNDVDETEYACTEKKRIMLRKAHDEEKNAIIDNYVPIFRPGEFKIRRTEDLDLSDRKSVV